MTTHAKKGGTLGVFDLDNVLQLEKFPRKTLQLTPQGTSQKSIIKFYFEF